MTQAEYARHRGVTRQAINKLVKGGSIELTPGGKIDAAAADRKLGEVRERIVAAEEPETASPAAVKKLTEAKTDTEVYRARAAQLDYEERIGLMLRTEDVVRS